MTVRKQKQRKDDIWLKDLSVVIMDVLQPSTLTYSVDHTVLKSRVNVQRLDPYRVVDQRIKVEILNIYNNNRRAQIANGVGENPLNRKGILLLYLREDGEIVLTLLKNKDVVS